MKTIQKNKFGTFQGVFTPSILTILGVIMYLRFGWVLGNAGLWKTLVIVTLSTSITFFTGLSVSALATNRKIGGGGAYYILSRSLGIEIGAAIGFWLFLAQALSIAFYVAGFTESLTSIYPWISAKLLGILTLIILTLITLKSADFALKTQYIILALIVFSLISFFMGNLPHNLFVSEFPVFKKESFWTVFAVFFPAVTGILSGIGMSGDLRDPAKSLPLGTFMAIGISYIIYMAIPVFLTLKVPDEQILIHNPMIMKEMAKWPMLIFAGIWGATLSSAVGSLLGAPRTLQALAKDKIIPRFLGRGSKKGNNPRIATVFTFLIALTAVFLGDLNIIAPVLTMFFLTTYGLLNAACAIETLIGSPSWRPKFKVHWGISLAGTFGCFAVMFMIAPGATFIAAFISLGSFYYMKQRSIRSHFGDIRYGVLSLIAQYSLFELEKLKPNARTWQPNIMVFSGSPTTRWHLVWLAHAISGGKGLLTVGTILADIKQNNERKTRLAKTVKTYLQEREIQALVKIYESKNVYEGIMHLIRSYGFGPLEPNTILIGQTEQNEKYLDFVRVIRCCKETGRNLAIIFEAKKINQSLTRKKMIDIWWNQKSKNAGFALALAYLLHLNENWKNSVLTMRTIITKNEDPENAKSILLDFIRKCRFEAQVEVLLLDNEEPFELIVKSSGNADFVFVGIRPPFDEETDEDYSGYYYSLSKHLKGLPATAIVMATQDLEFKNIFDEE